MERHSDSVTFTSVSAQHSEVGKQAIKAVEDLDESDLKQRFNVLFIYEEAVDNGEPSREFYTLFFKYTFYNQVDLDKSKYSSMGKLNAHATLHGHNGYFLLVTVGRMVNQQRQHCTIIILTSATIDLA